MVSVIIPVYNTERYIAECLDSLVSQTNRAIEVLCIDDVSTDGSAAIIKDYEKKYPMVRYLASDRNRGQAHARNIGLDVAKGEYIYFLDSDDRLRRNDAIETMLVCMESGIDMLFFDSEIIWEMTGANSNPEFLIEDFAEGIYGGEEFFGMMMRGFSSIAVWKQFWRKRVLDDNCLRFKENTSPHEDLLFSFQAILSAESVKYVHETLHEYRMRPNSSSLSPFSLKRLLTYGRMHRESVRFLEKHTVTCDIWDGIYNYFDHIRKSISDNVIGLVKKGDDINVEIQRQDQEAFYLKMLIMAVYPYLDRLISPDEYRKLVAAKQVFIYGAGRVGNDVARMLEDFGIFNYRIVVTKKKSGNTLRGREVEEIGDIDQSAQSDSMVILAATLRYRDEMENTLRSIGYKDYIYLCREEMRQ